MAWGSVGGVVDLGDLGSNTLLAAEPSIVLVGIEPGGAGRARRWARARCLMRELGVATPGGAWLAGLRAQAVLTEARLDRSRRGLGRTCEESAEHEAGGERGTKRDHGIPLDENVRQRLKVAVLKEFREQR